MDIKKEVKDLAAKVDMEDIKKKATDALNSEQAEKVFSKVGAATEKVGVKAIDIADGLKEAVKKM